MPLFYHLRILEIHTLAPYPRVRKALGMISLSMTYPSDQTVGRWSTAVFILVTQDTHHTRHNQALAGRTRPR
jgi:hypothetical protein